MPRPKRQPRHFRYICKLCNTAITWFFTENVHLLDVQVSDLRYNFQYKVYRVVPGERIDVFRMLQEFLEEIRKK
jgi:hypothetical protein